jgi:hypothetical protein
MTIRIKPDVPVEDVVLQLFNLAHNLKQAGGDGTDHIRLMDDVRSAGHTLWDALVALNNGRGPTGMIGG